MCPAEGECRHPLLAGDHVAGPTDVLAAGTWSSNPPSSGKHCGSWGAYQVFSSARPLPRCNYVHNLEHGAVVLLYSCAKGCSEIVAALQSIFDSPPKDPDCAKARVLVTPDGEIDGSVAAVAWGWTWRAAALGDAALLSLRKFVSDHIGSRGEAPEARVCSDGTVAP